MASMDNWIYSRLDRLRRGGSPGSYSNPRGPASAAVLRALDAAILRYTSALDDAAATLATTQDDRHSDCGGSHAATLALAAHDAAANVM
jgi:hypothetical protein